MQDQTLGDGTVLRTLHSLLIVTSAFVLSAIAYAAFPYSADAALTAPVSSVFRYTFNNSGTLNETGSLPESSSPYFWLNSGGKFIIEDGIGKTVQGALASNDEWRLMYAAMNPLDTGNGYYPQNTLRLVTRSSWGNVDERVSFRVKRHNLTNTPNRDGYSGVLLMGRYKDQYNLYYAGVRDDGAAVIKKKIGGVYTTLAQKQVFGTEGTYNRTTNPSLIPGNTWMGLRFKITNNANGSVRLELLLDRNNSDRWTSLLTFTDSGTGGAPLTAKGFGGIRSDYMDVEFDNYELRAL